MKFSEAITKSFKLWWKTLPHVVIFSFIAALLNSWPYFLHVNPENFHFDVRFIFIMTGVALINLIPNNAIFAKLGHAIHDQPISFTQAIAVSLVKFPQTVLWLGVILALVYIPLYFAFPNSMDMTSATQVSGWLFFIIAYVIFLITLGVYATLVFPLIINHNYSFVGAIKNSFYLIKGKWWYTSLVLSATIFIAGFFETLLRVFFKEIGSIIGMTLFFSLNMATITVLCDYHLARKQSSLGDK